MQSLYQYIAGTPLKEAILKKSNPQYTNFVAKLASESFDVSGFYLFNPAGAFQEYLEELEDGVLLYLHLSKYNFENAGKQFSDHAASLILGPSPDTFCYSWTPINRIRVAIRLFAMYIPDEMFTKIDEILQRLGEGEGRPPPNVKKAMVKQGKAMRAQLEGPAIPYKVFPLLDDPFSAVMNISQLQLPVYCVCLLCLCVLLYLLDFL